MSRVAAALVLMNTGAHVATAQTAPPTSQTSSEDRLRAAIEEARAKPYLDKDGGYKDKTGGYYNPKAGTYTDEKGGIVDNWGGYTYKDGSYKSKVGDYYDAPTNTVHLAGGDKTKVPTGSTSADVIKILRENVEANGGYDKTFIRRSMMDQIRKEHPPGSEPPAKTGKQ